MIRKRFFRPGMGQLLALALLITAVSLPAAAQDTPPDREPPDPQTVADKAIERIESLGDRCETRVNDLADKTIELLPTIEPEQAVRLARHNKAAINRIAARCTSAVRKTNRAAMILLRKLEAPELAEEVHETAKATNAAIRDARATAVAAIDDALDDLGLEPPAVE